MYCHFYCLPTCRYYWENNTLLVRMLNAECVYGYEYLGNSTRLVITPLTVSRFEVAAGDLLGLCDNFVSSGC